MLLQSKDKISFIVNNDDVYEIEKFIDSIKYSISLEFFKNTDLTCITIVGLGFTSSPSLSVAIINLLTKNDISIEQSNATNLSFSLLVSKDKAKKATNLIIEEFEI